MGEVEFDRLLDAVRTAISPVPYEDFMVPARLALLDASLQAANDNQMAWPLVPFPEGWNATC